MRLSLWLAALLLAVACGDSGTATPATSGPSAAAPAASSQPTPSPSARARCDVNEQLAVHYHAHLTVLVQGKSVAISANIGITSKCFYWLHTHDLSGLIHIEAPHSEASSVFTLGDFFDVWGQPLDATHVANLALAPDQKLEVYLDGQPYPGNPRSVPLRAHAQVVIEVTPPAVIPPPVFTFSPNS